MSSLIFPPPPGRRPPGPAGRPTLGCPARDSAGPRSAPAPPGAEPPHRQPGQEETPRADPCAPRPRCQAGLFSAPRVLLFFFFFFKRVLSGGPSLRACLLGTRQVARFAELHVCVGAG